MSRSNRNNTITLKVRKQWEVPTGHRQDRKVTTMDSRPRKQRTRQGVDKAWRKDYNMD